ncbi:MAG: site-2 protease family protein [Defluviitaleaceae bacterium]|nr:site-2 protease family protein [Defluviitaleaceae bacterium]
MFDIYNILMSIPGVIIAVTVHEYIKSLTAYKLGDTGIKRQGRLMLNPLKHMDILGSVFMVLFGYGWANPARLTPFSYADRKKAMLIIFAMSFLVNIMLGMLFAVVYQIFTLNFGAGMSPDAAHFVSGVLWRAAVFNISFALFNLIPLYPLDGANVLNTFYPMVGVKIAQAEKFLQIILAFAIILNLVAIVFDPLVNAIMRVLT